MTFEFTSLSAILFLATLVNLFVAVISWQRRRTKSGIYFALGITALSFWTLLAGLDYAAVAIPVKVFFAKLEYIAYNSALAFMVLFTIYYAGHGKWLRSKWTHFLLWSVPASNAFLALTNELHEWLWIGFTFSPTGNNVLVFHHGPGFIWTTGTGYLAMSVILAGLWSASRGGGILMRKQARLLFWAALIPMFGNVLYLLELEGMQGIDWTSILFSATGLIFVVALYGTHFLNLIPVARDILIKSLRDGLIVLDEKNRVIDINRIAADMVEYELINMIGEDIVDILPIIQPYLAGSLAKEIQAELSIDLPEKRYVDMLISPLQKESEEVLGRLLIFRDITALKKNELHLQQLTQAVEQSPATVMITNPEGNIVYVNPQFTQLTGYSYDEAIGKNSNIIQSRQTPDSLYKEMWKAILSGETWRGEFLNRKKNGDLYWEWSVIAPLRDASGRIINFIAVKQNITERKKFEEDLQAANRQLGKQLDEIKKLESSLREQATRDALTQLYNRRFLVDVLDREFSFAKRRSKPLSIIILDIDHFKSINDTYGHRAGDECLIELAQLLKEFFREADIVCRFGGEEFLVLLPDSEPDTAAQRAEAFRQLVSEKSVFFESKKINLTVSVGVASYPAHGDNSEEVIQKADQALYDAKRKGRNQVVLCTGSLD